MPPAHYSVREFFITLGLGLGGLEEWAEFILAHWPKYWGYFGRYIYFGKNINITCMTSLLILKSEC